MVFKITSVAAALLCVAMAGCDGSSGGSGETAQVREVKPGSVQAPGKLGESGTKGIEAPPPTKK